MKLVCNCCVMIAILSFIEHECLYPGCQLVIVIDGNQKNRRSVCMASQAGYVEYPSLPSGSIATGCTNSPTFKSRYCASHCPRLCPTPKHLQESDIDESGACVDKPAANTEEQVVGVIRDKRTTRSSIYYKVCNFMCTHTKCNASILLIFILSPFQSSSIFSMYRIVGNIGECFNLANWRF